MKNIISHFSHWLVSLEKIVIMADEISEKDLADLKIEENDEESTNYKAPAKKTINELNDLDAEDESLRKYKEVRLFLNRHF